MDILKFLEGFLELLHLAFHQIIILFVVFIISVAIQYKKKAEYYDNNAFMTKHVISHGLACIYALIYLSFLYFSDKLSDTLTDILAFVLVAAFFFFLFKIIETQNSHNGGYIENLDGASGALMFISAVMMPCIFIVVYLILVLGYYWFYKRDDDEYYKKQMHKRIIDLVEVIIAYVITEIFHPNVFIDNLRMNVAIISVFTLLLPFLNDYLYRVLPWIREQPSES